jgi:hypothetical protein
VLPTVVHRQAYDYTALDADNAVLARRTAEKIRLHLQRTSKEIIEIGADLIRVKDALGHGRFGEWFQAEFGWTIRTAQNYMRASSVFGSKCETVSYLPPKTLYLLSARSTPKNIVGEVVDMLEHGQHVHAADVAARIETARRQAKEEKRKHQNRLRLSKRTLQRKQREKQEREAEEKKRREEVEATAREIFEELGEIGLTAIKRFLNLDWDIRLALERLIGEAAS